MALEFELLEHPSDIGFAARGANREEALSAASHALVRFLVNPGTFRPLEERYFKAAGIRRSSAIVNWLNEILFFFDTEGMVFVEFQIDSWTREANHRPCDEARDFDTERHEFQDCSKGHDISSIREPSDPRRLGNSSFCGRLDAT